MNDDIKTCYYCGNEIEDEDDFCSDDCKKADLLENCRD